MKNPVLKRLLATKMKFLFSKYSIALESLTKQSSTFTNCNKRILNSLFWWIYQYWLTDTKTIFCVNFSIFHLSDIFQWTSEVMNLLSSLWFSKWFSTIKVHTEMSICYFFTFHSYSAYLIPVLLQQLGIHGCGILCNASSTQNTMEQQILWEIHQSCTVHKNISNIEHIFKKMFSDVTGPASY